MQKIFEKNLPQGKFEIYNDQPDFEYVHVHQIHSTNIVDLKHLEEKADGILFATNSSEKIAIKTADCMPIVILGEKNNIFLHAGWKGLANGILTHKFIKQIIPYYTFIGPNIHSCHFEVTDEFHYNFPKSSNFINRDAKIYFDLQKEAEFIFKEHYSEIEVETSPDCTHCNNKYNSYRKNKTPKRNWNIWTL